MPSINEISIAINSLFLDISDPITLGLNKTNFFNTYKNTYFKNVNRNDFEFNSNPVFRFDDNESLVQFLKKELLLSDRYQDNCYKTEITALLDEINSSTNLDDFYLNYTIEINNDTTIIYFSTNSLIFKYEVIG